MQNIRGTLDEFIKTLPWVDTTWKFFLLTEKGVDVKRVSKTSKFDCIPNVFKLEFLVSTDSFLTVVNNMHFMFQRDVDGAYILSPKWKHVKTELNENIQRLFSSADIKKRLITHFKKNKILYCPFCGSNQLQVYEGKSNFDIDHFLPKSLYPQYAFSLYNLIPICKHCNQNIKLDRDPLRFVTLNTEKKWSLFHPYFGRLYIQEIDTWKYTITQWKKEFWDVVWFEKCMVTDSLHARYFKLKDIYIDSPLANHDVDYMYGKRKNINEQQAHVKIITEKEKKDQLDRTSDSRYPSVESDTLSYPNGKMRSDLVKWMKSNI